MYAGLDGGGLVLIIHQKFSPLFMHSMQMKKTVSLKQVTFVFVAKKVKTALSDIFLNFWELCT